LAHIRWALEEYPIVLMGEGNHEAAEPHEVLRRILSDDGIMEDLDVIIVEFATATYQDVSRRERTTGRPSSPATRMRRGSPWSRRSTWGSGCSSCTAEDT